MSLVDDAQAAGLRVIITSGFRSIRCQTGMYNAWLASGKKGNPVGRPGHSGHNSGQAIDIRTSGMNATQRNLLGGLGRKDRLSYEGARDPAHFGAGSGNPIDSQLVIENNASPNPDSTIIDGGVTTVMVDETDNTTTMDLSNSTITPDQITPIDTQNLPLTPQPTDTSPPPKDQQNQQ